MSKPPDSPKPTFFATPAEFRKWLKRNHDKATELQVGFYKRATGKASITWPESVDQALCFGWIDGIRRSIDDESYMIRFTPRRPGSIWSQVNLKKVQQLIESGSMQPAGLRVYKTRDESKTQRYTFEQQQIAFDTASERKFRANRAAWKFFQAQPPGYRKVMTGWVMLAKQEATRERRLARLIEVSVAGNRVDMMKPNG